MCWGICFYDLSVYLLGKKQNRLFHSEEELLTIREDICIFLTFTQMMWRTSDIPSKWSFINVPYTICPLVSHVRNLISMGCFIGVPKKVWTFQWPINVKQPQCCTYIQPSIFPAFSVTLPNSVIILMACVQSTNTDSVIKALCLSHLCNDNLKIAEHDMSTAAQ